MKTRIILRLCTCPTGTGVKETSKTTGSAAYFGKRESTKLKGKRRGGVCWKWTAGRRRKILKKELKRAKNAINQGGEKVVLGKRDKNHKRENAVGNKGERSKQGKRTTQIRHGR